MMFTNMKFHSVLIVTVFLFNSCTLLLEKDRKNTASSKTYKNYATRGIATENKVSFVTISPVVKIVSLCGKKYSYIQWAADHSKYSVQTQFVSLKNSKLYYEVPSYVFSSYQNMGNAVEFDVLTKNLVLQYPILPSFPIEREDRIVPFKSKTCEFLDQNNSKINSSSLKINVRSNQFAIDLKSKSMNLKILQNTVINENVVQTRSVTRPRLFKNANYSLVIYYDSLYEDEMQELKSILESKEFSNVKLQSINTLPGINLADQVEECEGSYYNECYIETNFKNDYLTPDFIQTLYGVYVDKKNNLLSPLRYPYIPGLIRANIRKLKKENTITHALLVGSGRVISPFYVKQSHYHSYVQDMPSGYIHTDLYYSLPQKPLTRLNDKFHFEMLTSWLWSCKSTLDNKVRIKKWCDDTDIRHWPDPALSAYRFGAYAPRSILFEYESLNSSFYNNIKIDDFVSVGRIPTQDKLMKTKDYIVSNYVEKVEQWFENLPEMKENSIATYGGSTDDTWIFTSADSTSFKLAYGDESKIYASEFFVPLSYCTGCEYLNGDEILNHISQEKSRVAWLLNGHGSPSRIQAPYANGDIQSHFTTENKYVIHGFDIRKLHYKFPTDQTFKILENSETLVGHVFANSCSASDFNMTDGSEIDTIMYKNHQSNQRSWAEQLIGLKRSGAMNTIVNSDVGWSYQDNRFNQYFMNAVHTTYENCDGFIGDAYNLALLNLIKSKQLQFQVYNRQFLGLPVNPIAKKHLGCKSESDGD